MTQSLPHGINRAETNNILDYKGTINMFYNTNYGSKKLKFNTILTQMAYY